MRINEDFVPSTVEAAVRHIVESISDEERDLIQEDRDVGFKVHHTIGRYIRNNWSLWEKGTPLKEDAVHTYGIAHADDISGLIIDWVAALVRADDFDPQVACQRFHAHWKKLETDSLKAGGY